MEKLKYQVSYLIEEELKRANKKFQPKFNSEHEAYSIIKEEVEEATEELEHVISNFNKMWWQIRYDNREQSLKYAILIKKHAILIAAESIQVAAMCNKFTNSFEK